MDGVLFRCRVRGTAREGYRVRLSLNWAFARRADLILTESELVCGDWAVPYAEVEDAVLVGVPVGGGLGEQKRLIVRGRGRVYQFILPFVSVWSWKAAADPFWDGPLPFPVRRVTGGIERRSEATFFFVTIGVLLLIHWLVFVR